VGGIGGRGPKRLNDLTDQYYALFHGTGMGPRSQWAVLAQTIQFNSWDTLCDAPAPLLDHKIARMRGFAMAQRAKGK
jgi:hypothetical protein